VKNPLEIEVVSNQMQEVNGEALMCPEKATVLGPCRVIPQEYNNITCRSIDISLSKSINGKEDLLVDQLVAEFVSKASDPVVAYRGKHRWVQTFEPVQLNGGNGTRRLREGGVYLITGGLGGVGLVLAEYLAQTVKAKLILIGRSALPAREKWGEWLKTHNNHDNISRKIRKVQELESLGAEILTISADVANLGKMQTVIAQATERFGAIHGVIHAAGIVGKQSNFLLQETDLDECNGHFRAKVHGLFVLETVLRGRQLDFRVLTSSLSSVLGGLGYSAYAAANLFMDAFAHKRSQANDAPWISVNYDAWKFTEETERNASLGTTLAKLAVTPKEGVEIFKRALSMDSIAQLIISTGDLQTRINQWVKLEPLKDTPQSEETDSFSMHLRPNLRNTYVATENELQKTIAGIWEGLLGVEQIGIYDNFFELGGHSLLATQVISRIHDAFQVDLPLRCLFEKPTIEELAEVIEKTLVEEIEKLTEDETQQLLKREAAGPYPQV